MALGAYSNRVATHMFNLQLRGQSDPEYDKSRLFMTSYAKAYPRLLSLDYRQASRPIERAPATDVLGWDRVIVVDTSQEDEAGARSPPPAILCYDMLWSAPLGDAAE